MINRITKSTTIEERDKILRKRYRQNKIRLQRDENGNILYLPDVKDRITYYENCEIPELKTSIGIALTEMMMTPNGNDSWIEIQ